MPPPVVAPERGAPTLVEAAAWLAGHEAAEHTVTTLHGTFAHGYDAGHADGFRAGYDARAAEIADAHAALWAQLGPRAEGAVDAAARRAREAANAPVWPVWDAAAERLRVALTWIRNDVDAWEIEAAADAERRRAGRAAA
ncbi:MAG: hypothetical protein FWF90_05105 [Promicromonosporaceae bacterium]|nr:hypothetical protein [Promicromonosporaceae bacterium]